jgi:SAM-dependent methyltransferase
MVNNKEVYAKAEFDYWAEKEGLLNPEKYLIEKYLYRSGKTLEAGTGGGRISLEMKKLGFTSLYAFDYLPSLIERAKQRDTTQSISFRVEDATALSYNDCCFDQIVYLQQIICLIEDELGRLNAIKEAYRILKIGGTAIFSFLNFDARIRHPAYLPYIVYLYLLRQLRGSNRLIQYLPRLKLNGKFKWDSLIDRGAYVYWYKIQEIYQSLREVNFEVIAIGSDLQIKQKIMHSSLERLLQEPMNGTVYFVCKK